MTITNKAESNPYLGKLVEDVIETSKQYLAECESDAESVTITDWDSDRVSLDIDGREFSIRLWNIYEIGQTINFDWTLFLIAGDHGIDINAGGSTFDKE